MNPKNRNGPPKVVDQTPQESLLPAGRPGLPKFPLEDRSDRLGDPPPTVFPAGEVTGPTAPVGGPGPSGTTPRGRDDALDTRLLPEPSMGRQRPTDAGRLPGPTAEATETGFRGRPEPPGHRWPGAEPPRPSTTSGTALPDASRSRGGPDAGKSPSPPVGNASGTAAGSSPGPPSATWGSPDAA
jgi:hypothetical protein